MTAIDINTYQLIVLKQAAKLLLLGIKPNRNYTRKAVLAAIASRTGKKFPQSTTGLKLAIVAIEKELQS